MHKEDFYKYRPSNYNQCRTYLQQLNKFNRQSQKALCAQIEDLLTYFFRHSPSMDDMNDLEGLISFFFSSNIANLQVAYESVLQSTFSSTLILTRSSFESLLQSIYLMTSEKNEQDLFIKYLANKLTLQDKKDLAKIIGRKKFVFYPPVFFRDKLFTQGNGKLRQGIAEYYFQLSEIVHQNWTSITSLYNPEDENLKEVLMEILNYLVWFYLIHYEVMPNKYSKLDINRLGKILANTSKVSAGILNFYPENGKFRKSQEIIEEMINR